MAIKPDNLTPERDALWDRLFATTSPALMKTFKDFHRLNPHVFSAFVAKAREARNAGHAHYSAWIIVNVLRWESDLQTSGDPWRISNDHIAMYARLLVWLDPSFEGFFDLKQMKPTRGSRSNVEAQQQEAA